jgi:plastocyanin
MIAVRLASMAALALSPAAALASPTPVPVHPVALVSFAYRPAPIVLRAGQPVTLLLINRARGSHDFTAPAFFRSARLLSGQAPRGSIALRGGESASVTLIPARGRYPVHCARPFHKMMGMQTTIVVQ